MSIRSALWLLIGMSLGTAVHAGELSPPAESLKSSESELQNIAKEQDKMKGEIEQMNKDAESEQKQIQENKNKADKERVELKTLVDLKAETAKKIQDLDAERDKLILEMRDMDDEMAMNGRQLKIAKEQEKLTEEQLQKTQAEYAQKKIQFAAQAQPTQVPPPGAMVPRTPAVAQAAPAPASPPVTSDGGAPSVADSGAMVLKRDCKIYDKVSKTPKVVGMKSSGTSVRKSEEGSNWISFQLSSGQKGFVLKSCFQ